MAGQHIKLFFHIFPRCSSEHVWVVIGGNHVPHFAGTGNVEMSVVKQQVGSENSMPEHKRADIQICK